MLRESVNSEAVQVLLHILLIRSHDVYYYKLFILFVPLMFILLLYAHMISPDPGQFLIVEDLFAVMSSTPSCQLVSVQQCIGPLAIM